jgi:hypothetical protein
MTLKTTYLTVTDTPICVAVNDGDQEEMNVYLANTGGTHDLFLGDPSVTSTNGYVIGKFQSTGINNRFQCVLFSGEQLFAVCSSGNSTTVSVMTTGSN